MALVMNILFERSYKESRGGTLPAAHISCVTWWPGEAAQRRAAGLALSVPQVLHDCHDSMCYTALERYWGGAFCLGAASPSQQLGP